MELEPYIGDPWDQAFAWREPTLVQGPLMPEVAGPPMPPERSAMDVARQQEALQTELDRQRQGRVWERAILGQEQPAMLPEAFGQGDRRAFEPPPGISNTLAGALAVPTGIVAGGVRGLSGLGQTLRSGMAGEIPVDPSNPSPEMVSLGMGGALATLNPRMPEAGELGSLLTAGGRGPRRRSAYTQEPEALPTAPPPMGHNLPPEVPLLQRENPFSSHLDDMHGDELGLAVHSILDPSFPALKARSRGVKDIADELNQRAIAALAKLGIPGGVINGPSDPNATDGSQHSDELISRIMAHEARSALARSGVNASDWYTGKVNDAMGAASAIYPEIATDPNARAAFQAAMAVTSQGEVVPSNTRLADQAYEHYRQTGRFPENMNVKEGPSINGNFVKLNALLQHGEDIGDPNHMREFLDQDFTYGELKKLGFKMGSSELVDTKVKGSAILGSKIGGGFYQNLAGNYDPVTMDLWFMRNWGRLTGSLVGKPDITAQTSRLDNAIQGTTNPAYGPQLPGLDIDRARLAQAQAETGITVPKDDAERLVLARNLFKQHERDFDVNRALYDSGERVKSELTSSSQRFIEGLQGINQSPSSGGQRNWMRARVNRAREILAAHGHDLTNADLQAILWYPEKDLYSKLGGRESAGLNVDYATAMRDLARSKGMTDEQIDAAIRSLPRARGSGSSGRPGPNDPGGGAGRGSPNRGGNGTEAQGEGGPGGQGLEPVNGDPFAPI